ncbi:hypothetical protein [Pseudoalteromonas phenolica]|nr:hypothetical protein [Pseudoalteromonas phenolica]
MKLSLKKKNLKTLQQPLAGKQLGQAAGGVTTSRGWCVTTGLCTDSQLC